MRVGVTGAAGLSVGESWVLPPPPMPNTFTPGAITESAVLPFLKGAFEPQEAMQPSRAPWSLARAPVEARARIAVRKGRFISLLLA